MSIDPESTDPEAPDDALLRRYVLGLASAAESERVDQLSASSAEVATRLQGIEYDLIDAYAAGQLSREALTALRSSYLSQADWQAEVGFSDTLRIWQARVAAGGAAPAPSPSSSPFPRPLADRMPRWWIAAATAIALVAPGYLALDGASLRRDLDQVRAERTALDERVREVQHLLETQQNANANVTKELERLRARAGALTFIACRASEP